MREVIAILLTTIICAFTSVGGSSDPFYLPDGLPNTNGVGGPIAGGNGGSYSWTDTQTKTARANQSASGYTSCPVLISVGQSNDEDLGATAYTPANASAIHNFNPFDGVIYAGLDPLLGTEGPTPPTGPPGLGHYLTRLADNMVTGGVASCFMLVALAKSGTQISQWAPGGFLYPRLKNGIARLTARGFTTFYVLWGQGTADAGGGTSQASYVASGNAFFSDLPASVNKIFVSRQTYSQSAGGVNATIQAAQWNLSTDPQPGLINHSASPPIWKGDDDDQWVGSICGNGSQACRGADGLHFTDAGNISRATSWQTQLHASGAPF